MVPALLCAAVAVLIGTGAGSIFISPKDCAAILIGKIANRPLPADIAVSSVAIVWDLRLPRVLLAFLAGAALSASGAVMQSILKNPLASSFTLGVSSGASLGAGLVITGLLAVPAPGVLAALSVPLGGFLFSLLAVAAVMRFSRLIDPRLENNTIILVGIVLSLFINALLTLLSAFARDDMNRLLFWQMGSFALKGWTPVFILAPVAAAGIASLLVLWRELDIMTFGDDEAASIGVPVRRNKRVLVAIASVLTGCTVSFTGVIGFIDLAVPHMIRRGLGPSHRALIPFAAISGGIFMVLADLLARTLIPPLDLPVGAITALAGAPVFCWIYFASRKDRP